MSMTGCMMIVFFVWLYVVLKNDRETMKDQKAEKEARERDADVGLRNQRVAAEEMQAAEALKERYRQDETRREGQ